jgi:YegS/Rv2252/BmrU family lipid kinase
VSDWLIVNPAAGDGRAGRNARQVVETLQARGPLEIRETRGPKDATQFAQEAARANASRLFVLGGDGTVFEAVNGLIKRLGEANAHQVPLGILPVGAGNSLVRDLGYTSLEEGLEHAARGDTRRVDVLKYHAIDARGYSLNLLGVGYLAEVADFSSRYLRGLGMAGYGLGALAKLLTLSAPPITVRLDGVQRTEPACMVVVCNSRYTAGAVKIAPQAQIDDGLADVILVGNFERIEFVRALPALFLGTHLGHPKVKVFRARRIEVEGLRPRLLMPDGEVMGRTPLSCEVVPRAITLVA